MLNAYALRRSSAYGGPSSNGGFGMHFRSPNNTLMGSPSLATKREKPVNEDVERPRERLQPIRAPPPTSISPLSGRKGKIDVQPIRPPPPGAVTIPDSQKYARTTNRCLYKDRNAPALSSAIDGIRPLPDRTPNKVLKKSTSTKMLPRRTEFFFPPSSTSQKGAKKITASTPVGKKIRTRKTEVIPRVNVKKVIEEKPKDIKVSRVSYIPRPQNYVANAVRCRSINKTSRTNVKQTENGDLNTTADFENIERLVNKHLVLETPHGKKTDFVEKAIIHHGIHSEQFLQDFLKSIQAPMLKIVKETVAKVLQNVLGSSAFIQDAVATALNIALEEKLNDSQQDIRKIFQNKVKTATNQFINGAPEIVVVEPEPDKPSTSTIGNCVAKSSLCESAANSSDIGDAKMKIESPSLSLSVKTRKRKSLPATASAKKPIRQRKSLKLFDDLRSENRFLQTPLQRKSLVVKQVCDKMTPRTRLSYRLQEELNDLYDSDDTVEIQKQ